MIVAHPGNKPCMIEDEDQAKADEAEERDGHDAPDPAPKEPPDPAAKEPPDPAAKEPPPFEPEPGLTAPLDYLTKEEEKLDTPGILPGAGPDERPDPDEVRPEPDEEDE
jgi:hypothetical protein